MGVRALKYLQSNLQAFHPHPNPPPSWGGGKSSAALMQRSRDVAQRNQGSLTPTNPSPQEGEGWDGGVRFEIPPKQLASISPPP